MKNWMHTNEWKVLCWQDQDHQYHVKAYWNEKFQQAAERAPKITEKFDPRGCNNGIRNWYEQGYVSPREARYPSIKEDPTAYILAGD
jgi:hypothetical protein